MSHGPFEYVHKPTVVEAWQITDTNLSAVAGWCKGRVRGQCVVFPKIRDKAKTLKAQDNNHYALVGDYVLRNGKGFVRVRPEEFEKVYSPGARRLV